MKKTILIVDDTASVRDHVAQTLRDAGYDVLSAIPLMAWMHCSV